MFINGSSFCIAQVGVFSRSSSSSLGISAWQFSLSCNYNQKTLLNKRIKFYTGESYVFHV